LQVIVSVHGSAQVCECVKVFAAVCGYTWV